VGLRIAFVGGAVVALDFEKQVLHLPERTAVNGGSELFHRARELGFATSHQPRNKIHVTFRGKNLPFRGDGRFKIADAPIILLQSDRVGGLRIPQSFQMSRVESRSEHDLVGVNPLVDRALRFLGRLKDSLPPLILPLEPGLDKVHLLFVPGLAGA
jgi:hypothetical protein